MSCAPCRQGRGVCSAGEDDLFTYYLSTVLLRHSPPTHLGDVAGAGEAEGDRADGLGHEAHRDLVAAVPHGLDGLAHVPVVVGHADVLRARQGGGGGDRKWRGEKQEEAGVMGDRWGFRGSWTHHEGRVVAQRQEAKAQAVEDVDHSWREGRKQQSGGGLAVSRRRKSVNATQTDSGGNRDSQ